jgi:hypothetical protein
MLRKYNHCPYLIRNPLDDIRLLVVEAKIGKLSQKIEQETVGGRPKKHVISEKQGVSTTAEKTKHEKLGLTKR